mgnify:CR=1 FL=1
MVKAEIAAEEKEAQLNKFFSSKSRTRRQTYYFFTFVEHLEYLRHVLEHN